MLCVQIFLVDVQEKLLVVYSVDFLPEGIKQTKRMAEMHGEIAGVRSLQVWSSGAVMEGGGIFGKQMRDGGCCAECRWCPCDSNPEQNKKGCSQNAWGRTSWGIRIAMLSVPAGAITDS
jgi:hypothetical protein